MKKLLLFVAVILMAVSASAKRPTGLTLGGGFGVYTYAQYPEPDKTGSYEGFYAEVGYDLNFTKHSTLYFGGRFDWVVDGSINTTGWGQQYKSTTDFMNHQVYFDIPIKYRFNFNVSTKTKLYLEAGPTAVFWLWNRDRFQRTESGSTTIHRENEFDNPLVNYNRVNLALGGAFGVHFNHVKIYFGYDQCLFSSVKSSSVYNPFVNNCQFRLGAAYIF